MSQDKPTSYAADELQPSSAVNEQQAQSEREDGTNRGDASTVDNQPVETTGGIEAGLSADKKQPLNADAERAALSEREDGTNRG
jgi:hypothetical protein